MAAGPLLSGGGLRARRGLAAIYGLLLFVPGWIWSEFLIFDAKLVQSKVLCYPVRSAAAVDPCFRSIAQHLVAPFALMMVAVHLALWTRQDWLFVLTAVAGSAFVGRWSTAQLAKKLRESGSHTGTPAKEGVAQDSSREPPGSVHALAWKYFLTTAIAALASNASLFFLSRLVDPRRESIPLLFICTTWVVLANLLVAVQFHQRPARAAATALVAALTLMACGEALAKPRLSQSERIMSWFGIGTAAHVSLHLTADGEARLARAGLDAADVFLLSRLGEEYLVAGTADFNGLRRVALRKDSVLSWASFEAADAEPDAAPVPWSRVAIVGTVLFAGLLACILFIWPRWQGLRTAAHRSSRWLRSLASKLHLGQRVDHPAATVGGLSAPLAQRQE